MPLLQSCEFRVWTWNFRTLDLPVESGHQNGRTTNDNIDVVEGHHVAWKLAHHVGTWTGLCESLGSVTKLLQTDRSVKAESCYNDSWHLYETISIEFQTKRFLVFLRFERESEYYWVLDPNRFYFHALVQLVWFHNRSMDYFSYTTHCLLIWAQDWARIEQ